MVKVSLGELYIHIGEIISMIEEDSFNPNGKIGLIMVYNMNLMKESLRFYLDYRERLIEKYSDDVIDGKFVINPGTQNSIDFAYEIKEINSIEIEIPLIFIPLEDALKAVLPDRNCVYLTWFIKEYQEHKLTMEEVNKKLSERFHFT